MDAPSTLHGLADGLAAHGEREALVHVVADELRRTSFAELSARVSSLARGLRAAGVQGGERVALLAASDPEWIVAALATLRAGGVVVPLDVQLGEETLSAVLADAAPRLVVTDPERLPRIERRLGDGGSADGPRIGLLGVREDDERALARLFRDGDGDGDDDGGLPDARDADEPAVLFYTSGTTGTPKGVPLSHANVAHQLRAGLSAGILRPGDRLLLPLPFHHVYPFVIGLLLPLAAGLPVVLPEAPSGPEILRALARGEATVLVAVPRLYAGLLAGLDARASAAGFLPRAVLRGGLALAGGLRRLGWTHAGKTLLRPLHAKLAPRLRLVASGGSALPEDVQRGLESLGWDVAIGYGLTETSPLLTLNLPGGPRGSVGRAVAEVELVVDPAALPREDGAEDPGEGPRGGDERLPRGRGELLARGPNVFSGYRDLPEATREVLSEDGWFRTGDLARVDEHGRVWLEGRASTLIVTESGKNVQPEEVEEAYAREEAIAEAGVLQVGRKLVALIVPDRKALGAAGDGGDGGAAEELEQAVRRAVSERGRKLPSYQRLTAYQITREALPRTRLGKIRRHLLEERYERARAERDGGAPARRGPVPIEELADEDRALLEEEGPRRLWELFGQRFADRELSPDSHLELDLGIDSLGWLEWSEEVRRVAGVELEQRHIERLERVRDLLALASGGARTAEAEPGRGGSQMALLAEPEKALDEDQRRWLEPPDAGHAWLGRGLHRLARLLARVLFRLEVEGVERVPRGGALLLTPNHESYLDAFLIAAALPPERMAELQWAGDRKTTFGGPLRRVVARAARAVPVDPARGAVSSLVAAAAVLGRDRALVWFPEGRRSPSGQLLPFRSGVGHLLRARPVPVVPVHISGTHEALPVGAWLLRPRKVRLRFGEPVEPDALGLDGDGAPGTNGDPVRIAERLRERVAALG